MTRTLLHLVDRQGQVLPAAIRTAVEAAFAWCISEYPNLDRALLAGWAEELGRAMADRHAQITSPRRYAVAALMGKIREWLRNRGYREINVGVGSDLEKWIGLDVAPVKTIERSVLFHQLRANLNERDRQIVMLMQQDLTSPKDVAVALGISYAAAAKAIQRVKERIAQILRDAPSARESANPEKLCKTDH
jgi:DNA-directed RNA polymerase specialized sigma24 family protein